MTELLEHRCWAEVDLDQLERNFKEIQALAPHSGVMAVVKADAYGHGDLPVARLLEGAGAAWFAVSSLTEALRLRSGGIRRPILILGYTEPPAAGLLAEKGISQAILSPGYALALSRAAQAAGVQLRAQIKVDTGMGRIGFTAQQGLSAAAEEICRVATLPGLVLEGAFTHFAAADSAAPEDLAYTRQQYRLFSRLLQLLAERGVRLPLCHCCNSAAALTLPDLQGALIRPGIILYGCRPSAEVETGPLRSALRLFATVSMVKELRAGQDVGYGRSYTTGRPTRIATLTAGYADGYPRALSGRGILSLHGRPAPVVGRVCMDQLMADVSGIPDVQPGDAAILFGGGAADSLEEAAEKSGRITYELLCGISRRVPRVYTRAGVPVQTVEYARAEPGAEEKKGSSPKLL